MKSTFEPCKKSFNNKSCFAIIFLILVGGFTILEGNGRGSGARQEIRSGRGTGTITAEYNKVATVSTIVDDTDVEKISTVIADASYTGKGGDGIIVVSNVDSILNIASKKSGSEAL